MGSLMNQARLPSKAMLVGCLVLTGAHPRHMYFQAEP